MFIACLVMGIACLAYGACVMSLNSGTSFHFVWFALGLIFLLVAFAWRAGLFGRLPKVVNYGLATVALMGLALLVVTSAIVLSGTDDKGEPNADYLIVLGAQVRRDKTPTDVLRYRLEAARAYLLENPDTLCIVSGGKGPNEPIDEATCMHAWLVSHDIAEDRIIDENKSETTQENIRLSRALMKGEDPSVVVVTNDFHLYRALAIARKQGLGHVSGQAAYSTPFYLANNVLREDLGLVRDFVVGNI